MSLTTASLMDVVSSLSRSSEVRQDPDLEAEEESGDAARASPCPGAGVVIGDRVREAETPGPAVGTMKTDSVVRVKDLQVDPNPGHKKNAVIILF